MVSVKEVKCPKCGKMFIPAGQHAHVDYRGFYCKPTCWLHRSDDITDERKVRKNTYAVQQYTREGELVATYESAAIAGDAMSCVASTIAEACRSGRPYHGFLWKYAKDVKKEL